MTWLILTFGSIGFCLVVVIWRTAAIVRLPVHLRWELAPIPGEKGKGRYGGSRFEEYEWWKRPRRRSRVEPIVYMAKEVFLLRGLWKHNRPLWPFAYALHLGIYLTGAMFFFYVCHAVLSIVQSPSFVLGLLTVLGSIFAMVGYTLGTLGGVGLIVKRAFDPRLRSFSTASHYGHLLVLTALFVTGCVSCYWRQTSDLGLFIKDLILLNDGLAVALPLSLHITAVMLFLLYLPFTNMLHFVTKYFMYHGVRWNDAPRDEVMNGALKGYLSQPVSWSAPHAGTDGRKSWAELGTERRDEEAS